MQKYNVYIKIYRKLYIKPSGGVINFKYSSGALNWEGGL